MRAATAVAVAVAVETVAVEVVEVVVVAVAVSEGPGRVVVLVVVGGERGSLRGRALPIDNTPSRGLDADWGPLPEYGPL